MCVHLGTCMVNSMCTDAKEASKGIIYLGTLVTCDCKLPHGGSGSQT